MIQYGKDSLQSTCSQIIFSNFLILGFYQRRKYCDRCHKVNMTFHVREDNFQCLKIQCGLNLKTKLSSCHKDYLKGSSLVVTRKNSSFRSDNGCFITQTLPHVYTAAVTIAASIEIGRNFKATITRRLIDFINIQDCFQLSFQIL